MVSLIPDWLDAEHLLTSFGPYAIWVAAAIVFVECGLLFPLLPGDSLLFVAGILVAQQTAGMPNIIVVCILLTAAAIAGNAVGFGIGSKIGPALFKRPDSRFFKSEYLEKTHDFFDRYGAPAIILARFVPIVRTFITAVAGAGRMGFSRFISLSAIGGLLWASGLTLLGYWLGNIAFIRNNVEALALAIVAASVIPIAIGAIRHAAD
ncbi:MAG TPA: VTT domain-containing protein [Aeromicrobium sp.]|nr:VTT domain-containing protein [Aeromicrobium sp.]